MAKKRRRGRTTRPKVAPWPHLRAEEFAELERLAAEAEDRGEEFRAVVSVDVFW